MCALPDNLSAELFFRCGNNAYGGKEVEELVAAVYGGSAAANNGSGRIYAVPAYLPAFMDLLFVSLPMKQRR